MQKFFNHNHQHVTLVAHHCVLPVHMLAVGHYYTVATIVAIVVLSVYAAATIYHVSQESNNE